MIWDPVERLLWGFAIILLILCSIHYIRKGRQRESYNERIIMYGFASVFMGYAIERLFLCIGEIFIPGTYRNFAFYGDYSNVTLTFEVLTLLGYISLGIGYALFFLAFELTVKRTKFIITSIQVILLTLMIILPFNKLNLQTFNFLFSTFVGVFILIYYTKKSKLEFRAISSLIILGITLICFGLAFASIIWKQIGRFPLYFSPTLYILGALIIVSPTIIDPKFFSRVSVFWTVIGLFIITTLFLYLASALYIGLPIILIVALGLFTLFATYIIINTIFSIKSEIIDDSKEEIKGESFDFLAAITKPQKITEEEVTISKEKKICLVCKGKVARNNIFLCPKCDTFYCSKCSEALSDLENACWVCETPFDESKPVKLHEKKEEEFAVEEVDLKKIKKE